jgi:predicted ester cyclase
MSEENKAIARRSGQIIINASQDTLKDALAEVYPDDVIWHEADGDIVGIEGVAQFVSMIRSAIPDLDIRLEDDMAEGDKVVTRWIASGTHQGELMGIAPTGSQVTFTGITIHRIEDAKIVEEWSNWDHPWA